MQTVSFETAKKLKEAGFPQPDIEPVGQIWYVEIRGQWVPLPLPHDSNGCIYAPTATELLPEKCALVKQGDQWDAFFVPVGKVCPVWSDPNPHELAAKMWLQVNKK